MIRLLTVWLFFLCLTIDAANSMPPSSAMGGIRGKVVDSESNAPIEFTNVAVYNPNETKPIAIETTGPDGSFHLKNLSSGNYIMKISFVGYENKTIDSVVVTGMRPIDMGDIKLSIKSSQIESVVVKGDKSLYESKIDRKVFNVDKALVAQSGTATDVLQQVPSVSVDQDGNVSLRGSENVNILINGRPTMIDKATLLQQIPANSIEKVEVITNPSVKYDSEGSSGIINIVLKQGTAQGLNGTVAVNAGQYDKYNGSINVNYNPGKYNLFAGYSYRNDRNRNKGETVKQIFPDSLMHSTGHGVRHRQSNMFRLGIDYFVTPQLTLGVNGSINLGKDDDKDFTDYTNLKSLDTSETWYRNSFETEDNISKEVAAYLTQKFNDKGHELRIDYSFGKGNEDNIENYFQESRTRQLYIRDRYSREQDTINSFSQNQIISTDYTYPINEKHKIELGAKVIIRENEDDNMSYKDTSSDHSQILAKDELRSNDYKYHEDISSIYTTYSLTLGKFSAMVGVKAELAHYETELLVQNQNFKNKFFSFIPSLHMVQKLNETNELNLSYSRRINRPRGQMLNPMPDYDDITTIRIGNPNLKPEYTNSFELGYTFKPENLTIQPTLFYRLIQDRFTPYRIVGGKTDTVTFRNIDYSHSYGMDMAITYRPFKFWNLNISGSLFQYIIEATETNPEKEKFSYNAKIMSNNVLPMGFALQIAAFYRSPFITTQGESDPFYSVNIGAKKDLLKGKLTASFNYNDIFNTMRFAMQSDTYVDHMEMWRKRESSIIMVGLTYKFGKAPKGKKPQRDQNKDENNGGDEMMY